MREIVLSQAQKDEIQALLKEELDLLDEAGQENFWKNLDYHLQYSFLPDTNGGRNIVVKEKSVLLKEISDDAKKLLKKVKRLDEIFIKGLNNHLGAELGAPYYHETFKVGGQAALYYPSISTIGALETIATEAEFLADSYKNAYGSGYMEWFLERMVLAYPPKPANRVLKITKTSNFIKFITIILEEDDTERIYKQVTRSRWYKTKYPSRSRDKPK